MNISEIKKNARDYLGNSILASNWSNIASMYLITILYNATLLILEYIFALPNFLVTIMRLIVTVFLFPYKLSISRTILNMTRDGIRNNVRFKDCFYYYEEPVPGIRTLYIMKHLIIALWYILGMIPALIISLFLLPNALIKSEITLSILVSILNIVALIMPIYKYYSFAMSEYIKIEKPNYKWSDCLSESKKIMKERKFELFKLHFSFLGWLIVSVFTFGIGFLWTGAYSQTAQAEFYNQIIGYNKNKIEEMIKEHQINNEENY